MRSILGTLLCAILLTGCASESSNNESSKEDTAATSTPVENKNTASKVEPSEKPESEKAVTQATSDKPIVIDVRSEAEYDTGHIEGALLIPHDQIADKIGEQVKDKKQKILLYCKSGGRAGLALKTLEGLGYTDVENLGGLEDARKHLE